MKKSKAETAETRKRISDRFQAVFDATSGEVQWVVEACALRLSALLLVGGVLGDIHGQKRVFIHGNVLFGVSSLLCGCASSLLGLVLARAVQGAAAVDSRQPGGQSEEAVVCISAILRTVDSEGDRYGLRRFLPHRDGDLRGSRASGCGMRMADAQVRALPAIFKRLKSTEARSLDYDGYLYQSSPGRTDYGSFASRQG